ncbi:MAG: DUF6247 family protein [Pseudonocardiaceae bacterium]
MAVATTKIERSGPLIRAVLAEFAPDECALFEAEFQQAIRQVSEKFDLAPLDAVLDRWWGIAAIRATLCPSRSVRRSRGPGTGCSTGCGHAMRKGTGGSSSDAALQPGVVGILRLV